MSESGYAGFHFAEPQWLAVLLFVPMLWVIYAFFKPTGARGQRLKDFADAHLLPHLMDGSYGGSKGSSLRRSLVLWSIIWACAALAMAGPRWDYTDVRAYRPEGALVILLDLSRSMDVADVKPSRLSRARQEIEDILRDARGVNIGLVAFANIPHMITPLTDDRQTIGRLLPSIRTELVYTQGSQITAALDMARTMLDAGKDKAERHILILSDGGFEDGDGQLYRAERALTDKGVRIHVMSFGTVQGGPVPDGKGGHFRSRSGGVVMSAVDSVRLERMARDGNGIFLNATYQQGDTRALLSEVGISPNEKDGGARIIRNWDERFYIFLFPCLFLVLPWFRKGAVFPALIVVVMALSSPARAEVVADYFLTPEQKGRQALEEKKYEQAEDIFKDDPYRRGIVQYRAGDYEGAAKSFESSKRSEVANDAKYNLGNARLMEGKIDDAIRAYEEVLNVDANHQDAAHNLEIARSLKKEKEQKPQDGQKQDQQDNNDQKQKQKENQENKEQKSSEGQQSGKQGQEQSGSKEQEQAGQSEQKQKPEEQADANQQKEDTQGSQGKGEKQQQSSKESKGDQQASSDGSEESPSEKKGEQAKAENSYPPQPARSEDASKDSEHSNDISEGEGQEQAKVKSVDAKGEDARKEADKMPPQPSSKKAEDTKQLADAQKKEPEVQKEPDQAGETAHDTESSEAQKNDHLSDKQEAENNTQLPLVDKRAQFHDEPIDAQSKQGPPRTMQDVDADQWLNRIESDTDTFLRNKFYVESQQKRAREGGKPW